MEIKKELAIKYEINDENDYIDKVDEEFAKYRKTNLPCPRCGGKLVYKDYGSAHIVRCEKENCIKVTYRGLQVTTKLKSDWMQKNIKTKYILNKYNWNNNLQHNKSSSVSR